MATRFQRRAVLALIVAVASLALAAVALAATTIDDPDDTPGKIDSKSVTATKTKDGLIKITVTFFADVPAKGETGNEYLLLWKAKPHALKGAPPGAFKETPYKIQGPQTGKRDVFTGGEDGTPIHKTGTATVSRKGAKLTFKFAPKAIGSPKDFYYWHAKSDYYGPESECPGGPCEDNAPDGSKAHKQAL